MKVGELIKKLETLDKDKEIGISNCCDGFTGNMCIDKIDDIYKTDDENSDSFDYYIYGD